MVTNRSIVPLPSVSLVLSLTAGDHFASLLIGLQPLLLIINLSPSLIGLLLYIHGDNS